MQQNLPPAKGSALLIAWLILTPTLFASACATRSSHTSSAVRLNLDSPRAERSSLININTASPQNLERLPGIGKVIAQRIVTHRERYGPFRRAEHLMMVRGISDQKFRAIRAMVFVE